MTPAQAQSRLFGLFPRDSLPKLLPGSFELTLKGTLGVVGINGTVGFKGKTAPLNVGFSDIPKNLGPALLGTWEVGWGGFFVMSDVMYAKLSPSVEIPSLDVALHVQVFSTDILAGYKLTHARGSIGAFVGAKYTSMQTRLDVDLGGLIESRIAAKVSQLPPRIRAPVSRIYPEMLADAPVSELFKRNIELNPAWIDLLAGTRLLIDLGHGVRFVFRGEAGGLVAFMWCVNAGFNLQLLDNTSVGIEYRHLQYSYEKEGGLSFHAGITGPAIALQLRF